MFIVKEIFLFTMFKSSVAYLVCWIGDARAVGRLIHNSSPDPVNVVDI